MRLEYWEAYKIWDLLVIHQELSEGEQALTFPINWKNILI